MIETKKRSENEIYVTYRKSTVGLTDIDFDDLKEYLNIIVNVLNF